MSKGKNYNRIVFLTTLSVYLGLVLVGGSACNLSHSAMTRSFDIKNEIEVNDDFDNNPDKEFPTLFAQLLNDIKEEVEKGKIALPIQTDFRVDGNFTRFSSNGGGAGSGGLGSNVSDKDLSLLIQNAINEKFKPKAFETADYNQNTKAANISLQANSKGLSLKISFSKSKAEQFAEFLNREFSTSADSVEDTLLKQIYQNTNVTSENNQVFIVTRLPRAAIDSLLK